MPAWTIILSPNAQEQLGELEQKQQRLIQRAIDRMIQDPFTGNVKALQGKAWKGRYRKRVGRFRIIFIPYRDKNHVDISVILPRSEKTYR